MLDQNTIELCLIIIVFICFAMIFLTAKLMDKINMLNLRYERINRRLKTYKEENNRLIKRLLDVVQEGSNE